MARFLCFSNHLQGQKKQGQPSFDSLIKTLQSVSQSEASANSIRSHCSKQLTLEENSAYNLHDRDVRATHASFEPGRKSEQMNSRCHVESDSESLQMGAIRRSRSLGCELDKERTNFVENNEEDCNDQGSSCDGSHGCKTPETTQLDQDREVLLHESKTKYSDRLNQECIFSVGDQQYSEKGHEGEGSCTPEYVESTGDCRNHTSPTPSRLRKSISMPHFRSVSPTSGGGSPRAFAVSRNRSFVDLNTLGKRRVAGPHGVGAKEMLEMERDVSLYVSDKCGGENSVNEGCHSYGFGGLNKDWVVPGHDEIEMEKNFQGEYSTHSWGQYAGEDFKLKRIEDWVIDLQHCGPVEETNDTPDVDIKGKKIAMLLDGLSHGRMEPGMNPGMEAAKKYISSLNPVATGAQLANHGLTVVPFLSAFVGLKMLNLSGNSIVRMTAGALPRGLHLLNLSKNKISTIEGLRDLTRLRVLDLSYNKIVRIGHGLASCSTLKELYLAGNKISEVEGLHRLLKLAVLDLRFNKLSTSKVLGQLAANYNSLQAISLEGNPAQKNVGDEQLKKYLQGLLPQLAYYNRQPLKSSKDSSDRSVRLGMGSHQHERMLRSDHKSSRKGSKQSFLAATLSQRGQVVDSPKRTRSRHAHLPPTGAKTTQNQHQFHMVGQPLSLASASFPKSRSAGSLLVL